MKAVLYLRISDESQRNNTSLETQESTCRSYCASQEYEIVDVVKDEAISANKNNIQRVVELLDYCKKHQGGFDVLVVFNLSRFARSQEHHQLLRAKLRNMNIILRSASERIDESPTGRLIEGVLASVNEYDNDIRTEKTRIGMTQRLRDGYWPWKPPTGYYLPKIEGQRLCIAQVDEGLDSAIREVFEMYATGMYTFHALAKKLNALHLVTYRGAQLRFITTQVEKMIKNPFYCGILRSSIDDNEEHEGKHQPIISKYLWSRCMSIKHSKGSKGSKLIRKRTSPDFYLRGLMYSCKHHKYTGAFSSGSGGRFGYYFCQKRDCGNHSSSHVHDQFLELLEDIQPDPSDVDLYLEIFEDKIQKTYSHSKDEEKRLIFVLDALEQKKIKLMDMRMSSEIDSHEFVSQKSTLNSDIFAVKAEIKQLQRGKIEWQDVLDYGKGFITDIRGKCESMTDVEKKVGYISSIFPNGVVYNGSFLSNQQSLEIITVCNAQKRRNVSSLSHRWNPYSTVL